MREQPEQQAPPVQRLRVRYAKRGRLRFTSHRDFSRAFERAVFRARIPMAYSSGFNPHPRISYAGAAPTGSASEAEYLELALAQVVVPADVHAMLDGFTRHAGMNRRCTDCFIHNGRGNIGWRKHAASRSLHAAQQRRQEIGRICEQLGILGPVRNHRRIAWIDVAMQRTLHALVAE